MAIEVHIPVLVDEVLTFLSPKPGGVYVDATFGNAGHTLALFEKEPQITVIGIDQDGAVLEIGKERLKDFASKTDLRCSNFADLPSILEQEGKTVDGILLDLGVSSLQLDRADRGFSFLNEGPIDMRMSPHASESLLAKLKKTNLEILTRVLKDYGEERLASKIARRILEHLQTGQLTTTIELAEIVWYCYPPAARHRRLHPATRTFQALRIWVNDELNVLKKIMEAAPRFLKPEGRLVVISYHSLEDRIVKHTFRKWEKEKGSYQVLLKKPITPSEEEVARNRRSRSAKLRVLQRMS